MQHLKTKPHQSQQMMCHSTFIYKRFPYIVPKFQCWVSMTQIECTRSSGTITCEMGNDEWTVITLQFTDAFHSSSLLISNSGLWRNVCIAVFMSWAVKQNTSNNMGSVIVFTMPWLFYSLRLVRQTHAGWVENVKNRIQKHVAITSACETTKHFTRVLFVYAVKYIYRGK